MKQRGLRPAAEFVEGVPRKRPSRQGFDEREAERAPHIDLRVISLVEIDTGPDLFEWNDLLIDIGRSNHAKGTARSLGSIAITYIPSKPLNNMLRERHSRDYHDPQKKIKLFRKINAGLKEYIREASGTEYEKRVQQLTAENEARQERQRVMVGGGSIAGAAGMNWYEAEEDEVTLHDRLKAVEHPFGPYTMKVRSIDTYANGKKYGLDLSLNDAIHDVRNGLIWHLSKEEGLDVSMLRRDWDAHATIFDIHEHMGGVAIARHAEIPDELKFDAPDTELQVVARQLQ